MYALVESIDGDVLAVFAFDTEEEAILYGTDLGDENSYVRRDAIENSLRESRHYVSSDAGKYQLHICRAHLP